MTAKRKSRILAEVHESAQDLHEVGLISKRRMSEFEALCNPIAQAELLNRHGCELNVVMGLCIGHDSLFFKYAKGLTTVLVAKDRVR